MGTPFRRGATDPLGSPPLGRNLTPAVTAALDAAAGGHGLRLVGGVSWGQRSARGEP